FCASPRQLNATYLKGQEAMEYRMVLGDNVVIDAANLTEFSLFYDYALEVESGIINSLRAGDEAQAKKLIFQVIDDNLSSGMLSARLARCIFFDLIGTVVKALSGIRLDNRFLVQLDPIDRLLQCETLPQMKRELADILDKVCTFILESRDGPDRRLFQAISRYLDRQYMDPNLNVAALAQTFDISTTSLAKIFKENVGLTPLDSINRLRVEHALRLLITTGHTVEHISSQVGYGNVHTFIRVFKKLYGMTPGAYRELYADTPGADAPQADPHKEDPNDETL
ncbi:MAG TPA: AraC family transcriptional regulator, partial [Clostridia bacterium]|nr:AraC family transcriptional regulator [Clostridia bacterium]